MGILKTAGGILAGIAAVQAFKLCRYSDDLHDKAITAVAGSVLAATSYHLLKDEVTEARDELKKISR